MHKATQPRRLFTLLAEPQMNMVVFIQPIHFYVFLCRGCAQVRVGDGLRGILRDLKLEGVNLLALAYSGAASTVPREIQWVSAQQEPATTKPPEPDSDSTISVGSSDTTTSTTSTGVTDRLVAGFNGVTSSIHFLPGKAFHTGAFLATVPANTPTGRLLPEIRSSIV